MAIFFFNHRVDKMSKKPYLCTTLMLRIMHMIWCQILCSSHTYFHSQMQWVAALWSSGIVKEISPALLAVWCEPDSYKSRHQFIQIYSDMLQKILTELSKHVCLSTKASWTNTVIELYVFIYERDSTNKICSICFNLAGKGRKWVLKHDFSAK